MHLLARLAAGILAAIAGAITGIALALITSSLPGMLMTGDSGAIGGGAMALAFVTVPLFCVLGAITGIAAWRRGRGMKLFVVMVLSAIAAPVVMTVAEDAAMPERPRFADDGCENDSLAPSSTASVTVEVLRRTCLDGHKTLEVSVLPRGQRSDRRSRGNALRLDVSTETHERPITVRVLESADSIIAVAYDERARLVLLSPRVQGRAIRIAPRSPEQMTLLANSVARWRE